MKKLLEERVDDQKEFVKEARMLCNRSSSSGMFCQHLSTE